jgi:hypothetical protein
MALFRESTVVTRVIFGHPVSVGPPIVSFYTCGICGAGVTKLGVEAFDQLVFVSQLICKSSVG